MVVIPIRARTSDELVERIARHLVALLSESDDPDFEMERALAMLEDNDLWTGSMDPTFLDAGIAPRFHAFVRRVIVENEFVREAVELSEREFEPVYCDTAEDLISNLISAS